MVTWTEVFWKLVVGPLEVSGGERRGRLGTAAAIGGAAVSAAALTYWWSKLPEARRQELLSKGTDTVMSAFSGRTRKALPTK